MRYAETNRYLERLDSKQLSICKMAHCTLREVETLKCTICDNVMSIPPILIIPNNWITQKCGRCNDIGTVPGIRNDQYEKMAQYISFPCIYKDCNEKIPWAKVQKHEMECSHRTMQCPIYWQRCNHIIKTKELQSHFGKCHPKNLFYECIFSRAEIGNSNVFLLVKNDNQFLVYVTTKVRIQKMYIVVFTLEPMICENYNFKVKLTSTLKPELHITVKNQQIVPFNERKYCRRCMGRECNLRYHKYSLISDSNEYDIFENMTTEINCKNVRGLLQSDVITFSVTITEKEMSHTMVAYIEPSSNQTSCISHLFNCNTYLRRHLECPVCPDYMEAPIFVCRAGHGICKNCKPKFENCPTCKVNIGKTRNYALEAVAENLEFPCLYNKEGCNFFGILREIREHELCEHKLIS